jgi:hypothetical protein
MDEVILPVVIQGGFFITKRFTQRSKDPQRILLRLVFNLASLRERT